MARSSTNRSRAERREASGVYAELDDLIRLKHSATSFSLRPRQPVHSVLAGRKASRLRGRGLDFEELRGYLPGDDVRSIDWKATARLREPHVRVYLEERDRPCVLVVDQRMGMFFGSRERMKSVAAAQCAALAGWRALSEGDRVGAVVFGDDGFRAITPLRSGPTVMAILSEIVRFNLVLRADRAVDPTATLLTDAITHASRMAKHDALVVVISDFAGADDATRKAWMRIASHNDTLAIHVTDPLETELPERVRLTFQQDDRQVEVDTSSRATRATFRERFAQKTERAREFLRRTGTPVLELSTVGDAVDQINAQLGGVGGAPA